MDYYFLHRRGAMILAVFSNIYIGMLTGLFIVALGFSLQQTAAILLQYYLATPKPEAAV
jgi:FHS family L-fucose permease-like MFS transporter